MFISKFHVLRWIFPTNCPYPTAPLGHLGTPTKRAWWSVSMKTCKARSAHLLRTPSQGADSSRFAWKQLWDSEIPTHGAVIQCTKTLAHEDTVETTRAALTRPVLHVWKSSLPWSTFAYTYITKNYECIFALLFMMYMPTIMYFVLMYIAHPHAYVIAHPTPSSPKFDPILPTKSPSENHRILIKANIADLQNFCREGWLILKKRVHFGDP